MTGKSLMKTPFLHFHDFSRNWHETCIKESIKLH